MAPSAAVILGFAAPVSCQYSWACFAGFGAAPALGQIHEALFPLIDKTHLGALRVVHFLALAHLAYAVAGEGGPFLRSPLVGWVAQAGRQTLAVFLVGLVLAQGLGVLLDATGRTMPSVALTNLGGCFALVLIASAVEWFKTSPWARPRRPQTRHGDEPTAGRLGPLPRAR